MRQICLLSKEVNQFAQVLVGIRYLNNNKVTINNVFIQALSSKTLEMSKKRTTESWRLYIQDEDITIIQSYSYQRTSTRSGMNFTIMNSRNTHYSDESPAEGRAHQLWGVVVSELTPYGENMSFGVALNESTLTTVVIPDDHAHLERLKNHSEDLIGKFQL